MPWPRSGLDRNLARMGSRWMSEIEVDVRTASCQEETAPTDSTVKEPPWGATVRSRSSPATRSTSYLAANNYWSDETLTPGPGRSVHLQILGFDFFTHYRLDQIQVSTTTKQIEKKKEKTMKLCTGPKHRVLGHFIAPCSGPLMGNRAKQWCWLVCDR